jgi:membrane peptidoglycan carboxypeptidase
MSRRRPRRSGRRLERLRAVVKVSVVLVVGLPLFAVAAGAAGLGLLLYGDLPGTVPEQRERVVSMPTMVLDATGQPLGTFREFDLTVAIEPEDVPQVLKDAVVASEDRNFWDHPGVDLRGMARAVVENTREGEVIQGGSTVTQQLVKNRYLSPERTLERKLDEMILAARLEREMTKEEILFEYLDTTYFGGGAYGVGAAAESYFHKHVSELTASEAALLAGIIPAPSELGPRENPEAAEYRRKMVLDFMVEQGMLDDEEHAEAVAAELYLASMGFPDRPATFYHPLPEADTGPHPFFLDYVRHDLVQRYGEDAVFRGGLLVETTLDPVLQAHADAAVAAHLEGTDPSVEMSLVSVEPATGHVKALVGGRDWDASQVNLALGGSLGMQPGSSFKTYVLAAALEAAIGPETVYPAPGTWQVPGCVGDQCTVKNYDGRGHGSMTLRSATWQSTNTVYAALTAEVGPAAVAEVATRLGVGSLEPDHDYGISLALGSAEVSPLDMAASYAVLANHGVRAVPTPVLRVLDAEGNVLEDNTGGGGERVMNAAVADTVTDVLAGVVTSGTGRAADIGRPVAAKTGTAEDYRAAWFVGYTPQLSTAVWMGHADEPLPLRNVAGLASVTGGSLPARAWAAFMAPAHEALEVIEFTQPGPLPGPGGDVAISPGPRRTPSSPAMGCGGRCDQPPTPTPTDDGPAGLGSGGEDGGGGDDGEPGSGDGADDDAADDDADDDADDGDPDDSDDGSDQGADDA